MDSPPRYTRDLSTCPDDSKVSINCPTKPNAFLMGASETYVYPVLSASSCLLYSAHLSLEGHWGNTTIAGNFILFIESKNKSAPQVSCDWLSFPRSPAPWRKITSGYFLPIWKLSGVKILQGKVSSPTIKSCFSNKSLFCAANMFGRKKVTMMGRKYFMDYCFGVCG